MPILYSSHRRSRGEMLAESRERMARKKRESWERLKAAAASKHLTAEHENRSHDA